MTASADNAGAPAGNRYDKLEWAGAFGDLGTLVPFLVAYITVVKVDPLGMLLAFGTAMVACGLFYKTPIPVQPMKAIGAVAAAQAVQTATVTPATLAAAALICGLIWLVLGVSGAARRVVACVPPPVVAGLVLGLGFALMLEGAKLMQDNWLVAAIAAAGTLLLLNSRRVPAIFLLLMFGIGFALFQTPELLDRLAQVQPQVKLPAFTWGHLSLSDLAVGGLLLALPQLPLTLGNAVIAIKEENNRLFPDRAVSERSLTISTGLMNVAASAIGGVPMCHGAGGMAAHVAFGARTGGATVILGVVLVVLALCFSGSVSTMFELFPPSILGVILAISGAQLAIGATLAQDRTARVVALVTAAMCMWNVGIAFVIGVGLHLLARRGLMRI